MGKLNCKHDWIFMGLVLDGMHPGMAHRSCKKCYAQLYTEPTEAELKLHDPDHEMLKARMKSKKPDCRPVFICTKDGQICYVCLTWEDAVKWKAAFGCTIWNAVVDGFFPTRAYKETSP